MCEAIGHPVDHLTRVAIGPIRDPRLKVGQWRELTADEVKKLRRRRRCSGCQTRKRDHGGHGHGTGDAEAPMRKLVTSVDLRVLSASSF